jgi:NAD(P)-dependent dehydrogenase (short-subunit alcohol dehydrogenase family)
VGGGGEGAPLGQGAEDPQGGEGGANQGLGRALVEGLAARLGPDDMVLLTGRNDRRVAEAAAEVAQAPATRSRVEGRVLDVTDADAVDALAAELHRHEGGADVGISNAVARLLPDRSQSDQADEFIDVANAGTHAVLRSFGPVLRPGGRLIVVASTLGTLGHLDRGCTSGSRPRRSIRSSTRSSPGAAPSTQRLWRRRAGIDG